MSDNLSGIFDHLNPSDFERATSAVVEEEPSLATFDAFIDAQIRAIRYAFAASDGDLNPLTTVSSASIERVYAADDDETLGQYIERVAREARAILATRMFTFKRTIVGTFDDDEQHVSDSKEAMQRALDAGTTREAVYWYAEDSATNSVRHGYITIEGIATLGEVFEGQPQRNQLFGRVLGGQDDG